MQICNYRAEPRWKTHTFFPLNLLRDLGNTMQTAWDKRQLGSQSTEEGRGHGDDW